MGPIGSFQCIGEGWDNKVFLLNSDIVFRFPRRKVAAALIARENQILPELQSRVDLCLPYPQYRGVVRDIYPYPFHAYKKILGRAAHQAELSADERIASLESLAIFLKQIHAIGEEEALAMGAAAQIFDRTEIHRIVNQLQERIEKIMARDICRIEQSYLQDEIMQIKNISLAKHAKCLVHGDLYCRHLIFHHKKLTGVIDWGDVGINSPVVDLAVIWSFYPQEYHSLFLDIYGAVDEVSWRYARFLGLYSAFVMLYAHDMDDRLLCHEALDSVKRIHPKLIRDSS